MNVAVVVFEKNEFKNVRRKNTNATQNRTNLRQRETSDNVNNVCYFDIGALQYTRVGELVSVGQSRFFNKGSPPKGRNEVRGTKARGLKG